jgi:uroporphyrinogen decarboxylase
MFIVSTAICRTMDDPDRSLPFLRKILSSLRQEVEGKATLIGFVGTPWTLAAYAMEGGADKSLVKTKTIMLQEPEVLHALLAHFTEALAVYICHQIDSGAQVRLFLPSFSLLHHFSEL